MRKIKILLLLLFLLFAFLFIVILLLPSHVSIDKKIVIHANKMKVASQISDLPNWKNWYPLFQNKKAIIEITRKSDTAYATVRNDNKLVHIAVVKNSDDTIQAFLHENYINKTYQFTLLSVSPAETQLTWHINFQFNKYSVKKFLALFIYKIESPGYDMILNALKQQTEKPGS